MRRKDREITEEKEILAILQKSKVMHLACCKDNMPYVIPLNFAYEYENGQLALFFHCANEGKKLDILKQNPHVAFAINCDHQLLAADEACGYGYAFSSLMGEATAEIINSPAEKARLLSLLLWQQAQKEFSLNPAHLQGVTLCRLNVSALSAKKCTKVD